MKSAAQKTVAKEGNKSKKKSQKVRGRNMLPKTPRTSKSKEKLKVTSRSPKVPHKKASPIKRISTSSSRRGKSHNVLKYKTCF